MDAAVSRSVTVIRHRGANGRCFNVRAVTRRRKQGALAANSCVGPTIRYGLSFAASQSATESIADCGGQ
jgi:hypothetical protein